MKTIWNDLENTYLNYYIAGDIGGTNTNLSVVGEHDDHTKAHGFDILLELIFPTAEIDGLEQPLTKLFQIWREKFPDTTLNACCISAAGPVEKNYCALTNADWNIDGNALSNKFSIPVFIINDFLGLSYGVPLLDIENEDQIHIVQRGIVKEKHPIIVLGAGTGLGFGFILPSPEGYRAYPSEAGHIDYSPRDTWGKRL
jgi:glucokinase